MGGWKTVGLEKTRHKCWQVAREGVLTLGQLVHHGELQQKSLPWRLTFGAGEDAYRPLPHVGLKRQQLLQSAGSVQEQAEASRASSCACDSLKELENCRGAWARSQLGWL